MNFPNAPVARGLLLVFLGIAYLGITFAPVFGLKAPVDPAMAEFTKSGLMLVFGFYFGSSFGSQSKDSTIANALKK